LFVTTTAEVKEKITSCTPQGLIEQSTDWACQYQHGALCGFHCEDVDDYLHNSDHHGGTAGSPPCQPTEHHKAAAAALTVTEDMCSFKSLCSIILLAGCTFLSEPTTLVPARISCVCQQCPLMCGFQSSLALGYFVCIIRNDASA
jgi:hypothetical protein